MGREIKHGSSKYDYVKVKVWLGDHAEHYYVFSRFLLCQNLTVTKIPNHISIKIALDLKKLLVDNSLLDVSQSDLEENLFKIMEQRGFREDYVKRYRMMTRFHHQRVPLVIIVCGTSCVGKSTIAAQISQRFNLPNVMQTDVVYELLRTSTDAPLASTPIWARDFSSSEELITEFCRECRVVRKGLAGDLKKALKDGKPIIIEGIHLDPNIFLMYEEKSHSPDLNSSTDQHVSSEKGKGVYEKKGENVKGPDPIIIPLILNMAEFEHQALLEEWFSSCTCSDKWQVQDRDKLISNVKMIQDYLHSFDSKGLTVLNLSAATFAQTLDWLHGYILERIEQGMQSASNENGWFL
ncbi:uncharacterized protein LOC133718219 [Rosa rugosa]|uniref:uncharacterized protein LOC133718219 n=1 Tax=Rosa rugosa TaxID=74645 RepID=UPI002B407467|nr:uncharacterized protein LOC133718219 [Rosa rugosa]XP_062001029.1 uncharacterized protein LOC133718219 [Rosa rugosa]